MVAVPFDGDGGGGGGGGGGVTPPIGGGGGDGGVVVPVCWTVTASGTVMSRETPGPDSQTYTKPELVPSGMELLLTVILTVSRSVVMVLLLP